MNPKFSIIVPNYNSERTIKSCLDSLRKLDYSNYEVVVVDDNSTDRSKDIIKKYPVKLIEQKQRIGAAEIRNIGVRASSGDLIMFTDSDIINFPNTLKLAAEFAKNNPDVGAFVGIFSPKIEYKNFFSNYKNLYLCYYFDKQNEEMTTLNTSLTFIRKDAFNKVGGFNKNLKTIGEDVELATRLVENGYSIKLNKKLKMRHRKYYSFRDFVKGEIFRGRKMFRVFLISKIKKKKMIGVKNRKNTYVLRPANVYASLVLSLFPPLNLSLYFFIKNPLYLYISLGTTIAFLVVNIDFWNYLKKHKNLNFALKSAIVTYFDMLLMNLGIFLALKDFIMQSEFE